MIRGFSFQRGLSLLATMAFATSMMLFAAVIIALPVTFGQMERLRSNSQEAERMAWSITQLAQAELEANPEWGKDGTADLVLEGPGWPGKATLSFCHRGRSQQARPDTRRSARTARSRPSTCSSALLSLSTRARRAV